VFELTGEYSVILPLMEAIVVATAASAALSPDTIYTLKLRRRGIRIDRPRVVSVMRTVPLAVAMGPLPQALAARATPAQMLDRFAEERAEVLPVVDDARQLLGIVTARAVEEQALADPGRRVTAERLSRPAAELREDDLLEEAVRALSTVEAAALPVLAAEGHEVVGWVEHRDILRAYHDERERLEPRRARSTVADGAR
jgi:CIC family chloride channel protein